MLCQTSLLIEDKIGSKHSTTRTYMYNKETYLGIDPELLGMQNISSADVTLFSPKQGATWHTGRAARKSRVKTDARINTIQFQGTNSNSPSKLSYLYSASFQARRVLFV